MVTCMTAGLNIGHNHLCFKPTISILKTENSDAACLVDGCSVASGHSKEPQAFSLGITHDLMTPDQLSQAPPSVFVCCSFTTRGNEGLGKLHSLSGRQTK